MDPARGMVVTRDGRTITGRYLIGADEVNSRVRRAFPTTPRERIRWYRNLAGTLEVKIPRTQLAPLLSVIDHPNLFFDLPGWKTGYGWAFPGKEEVTLGVGGLKQGGQRRIADIFKNCLAAGVLKEKVVHLRG